MVFQSFLDTNEKHMKNHRFFNHFEAMVDGRGEGVMEGRGRVAWTGGRGDGGMGGGVHFMHFLPFSTFSAFSAFSNFLCIFHNFMYFSPSSAFSVFLCIFCIILHFLHFSAFLARDLKKVLFFHTFLTSLDVLAEMVKNCEKYIKW